MPAVVVKDRVRIQNIITPWCSRPYITCLLIPNGHQWSRHIMPICTSCTHPIPFLYTVYESDCNLRLEQCVELHSL